MAFQGALSSGASISPFTETDLTTDIERLIAKVVRPYVDPSNPMLHFDELQAECRAKLAQIIDGDQLSCCPTRAKRFAFVKTSFRNRVRGLVQKHAFTTKRTGMKPPPNLPWGMPHPIARKVQFVNLDDPENRHQIGIADDGFSQGEMLEALFANLSPPDCAMLRSLVQHPAPVDSAREEPDERYDRRERRALLRKCRVILSGHADPPRAVSSPCNMSRVIFNTRASCAVERSGLVEPERSRTAAAAMVNTNTVRRAIKSGDTEGLKKFFKEGLSPNYASKQEWTLLHLAAKAGQNPVLELLLDSGAKIDALTEMRQTALDVAEACRKPEAVQLLKKRGARSAAELSLHAAVIAGDLKWVRKHLGSGADINAKDRGELPLCLAFRRSKWDVARFLMKKSPDVKKRQDNGDTALHEAACAGAEDALLREIVDLREDVNAVGCGSMTPLCYAAREGHSTTVTFLLQHGADVAYRAKNGTGPVEEALYGRHTELASFLINSGGKCTLHQAVQCDHVVRARELLSAGADVREHEEGWSDSPMGVAIWKDSVEMVKLLLEFGADPNEQDAIRQGSDGPFGGGTPLHDAVYQGSAKMVKLLLAHGADPDVQNAERLSPLELARRLDQTHLVKLMEVEIDRAVAAESVDQLYTIGKVAELLSVEEAFVTNLLAQGKIRQVRLDATTVRVPASSLRKYISKLVK